MVAGFENFDPLMDKVNSEETEWEYSEEPHVQRRQAILKKHPEMKKLMGSDPHIAYVVTTEVLLQLGMCWVVQDMAWGPLVVLAWFVGATLNHSLGSAIHEIGHNLAFGHKRPACNRWLSIWCNLPLGIPMAISYKKYHADHHRYLGEEYQDVDIPTRLEIFFFRNSALKIIWLFFHPAIHGLRPFFKSPKPISGWEIVNMIVQMGFNVLVIKLFGVKPFLYLLIGTWFGFGMHPLAGHFISEHYLFNGGQATHSYYGPLNKVLFNVGYHIEHHDFPYIPYTRLSQVREIAPEFYKDFPYHTSLVAVIFKFFFKSDHGPQNRGVGYKVKKGPSLMKEKVN